MAHLFATQLIVPVVTSIIFDKNRNNRYVEPACSLFRSAALAWPQWVGFVSLNDLQLFSLRKPVFVSHLWSALTDSRLGSFDQNPDRRRQAEIGLHTILSHTYRLWNGFLARGRGR